MNAIAIAALLLIAAVEGNQGGYPQGYGSHPHHPSAFPPPSSPPSSAAIPTSQATQPGPPSQPPLPSDPYGSSRYVDGNAPQQLPPQYGPPPGHFPPPPPPPPLPYGIPQPYRRADPPVQQDGLFSRIRGTLNALANNAESSADHYYRRSSAGYAAPRPHGYPPLRPSYPQEEGGLLGKLRSFFRDEDSSSRQANLPPPHIYGMPSAGGMPPSPPPRYLPPQQQTRDGFRYPEPPVDGVEDRSQYQFGDQRSAFGASAPPPPPQYSQYAQYSQPAAPQGPASYYDSAEYHPSSAADVSGSQILAEPPAASVSREPQVFVHGGGVVMVLDPAELERKKQRLTAGGSAQLQVFTDFERVLTTSRLKDGSKAVGSEELLEVAGAVAPEALQSLQQVLAETIDGDELKRKCLDVVQQLGRVSIYSVAPAVRAYAPLLGIREQARDVLSLLTHGSVPCFIFSAGYGDVVRAALAQTLASSGSAASASTSPTADSLPDNVRVISNFMRAGPDGQVRGFSSPMVCDSTKNATTASASMGLPLPSRPHAIVLASHEDDVDMTAGLDGVQEVLTVGFLEVTEDLAMRLPAFLRTFDVVLVGDCSMAYVATLLEDVLSLPRQSQGQQGGKLDSLRKGLGALLGAGQESSPAQRGVPRGPQQPPQQQPSPAQYGYPMPPSQPFERGYGEAF